MVLENFEGLHGMAKQENVFAGCSKRPSSKAAASEEARRTLRYVEPLSETRTKLAGFFSILRRIVVSMRQDLCSPPASL
jgi:hypothetical protein